MKLYAYVVLGLPIVLLTLALDRMLRALERVLP